LLKEHLFDLEKEHSKEGQAIYVLYPDESGNGRFTPSLFPQRALRVANHSPGNEEDYVMKSWQETLAFLVQC